MHNKVDLSAVHRVNGKGGKDPQGSYIKLVYPDGGANTALIISEGCAETLIAELQGCLSEKSNDAVLQLQRNSRGVG